MDNLVAYRARDIARRSGYDPDQLVVDIDQQHDFDLLHIGVAPVEIQKIKPLFMKFYEAAQKELQWENQSQLIATT